MPPEKKATPESLLRTVFGYETYRPLQREIIETVLKKQDALAIMPTGGGKSLCYQIPALLLPGLTVVVSPLISLMQDQVAQLNALGVPTSVLNSSLDWDTYTANMNRVRQRKARILFVAPETLLTDRLEGLLDEVPVDLLTIDEAHCISEWGHDFRPEYRQLVSVRKRHPGATCLALTATATERVRKDIQAALGFKTNQSFIASFDRPNLFLEVRPKQHAQEEVVRFIRKFPNQSGIIYCFSRQQVDTLAAVLKQRGFSVRPYHAGMADEDRRKNQDAFVRDDVQIMVATIAFGMGINKPNVRFIVHYDLPQNLESYYQQVGRAGRDGLPAHCLLLYSYGDTKKIEFFIQDKQEPEQTNARQHLRAMVDYAESRVCRRIPLLRYFGEKAESQKCDRCDICTGERTTAQTDLSEPARLLFEAMRQTGEKFGAAHLADILLGQHTEKVEKFDHQYVKVFGKGKHLTPKNWLDLARQLEQLGLVERTEFQGLRLSAQGSQVIIRRTPIMGASIEGDTPARSGSRRRVSPEDDMEAPGEGKAGRGIPLLEYDIVLFDLLRQKRKEIADQEKVPAYVILPDRTLVEISTYFPMSLDSLSKLHGIGQVKLEKYGKLIVQMVQDYSRKKALG